MSSNSTPCPTENEGNIVNVHCGEETNARECREPEPKQFILLPKEPEKKFCCFDVYMTRFWVTHNRDINPAAGMILAGYANEQSAMAPGLASRLHAHPKHGWININQKIGHFKVEEGKTFPVLLRLDAAEWGGGLDGATDVGSDLEGDAAGEQIVLDCSSPTVPVSRLAVKLQRPKGGEAGRVVVEFAAFMNHCC